MSGNATSDTIYMHANLRVISDVIGETLDIIPLTPLLPLYQIFFSQKQIAQNHSHSIDTTVPTG